MSGSEEVWFLGRVNRTFAEELLFSAAINGSFNIRSSESVPGAYALTVWYNKAVHTYRIVPTENRMLAVQTLKGLQHRKFSTLTDLVREYRSPQNGLICALTNPIGYEGSSASAKNHTPDSFSTLPRKDPLPAIPSLPAPLLPQPPQASQSSQQNFGIKIMPHHQAASAQIGNNTVEKPRNLPPVPNRDSSKPKPRTPVARAPSAARKDDEVKEKVLSRLIDLKSMWPNLSDFFDIVQTYTKEDGLLSDLSNIRSSCGQCASLQTLLAREAVVFQSELETFLTKIDILRQLFDFNSKPRRTNMYNRSAESDVDLDTFLGRLGDCRTVVKSLNMRVCLNLQEQLGVSGTAGNRLMKPKRTRAIEPLREKTFDVKHEGALKFSKQKLKLDIVQGKLLVMKADGVTEHDSSKVLQLIKCKKSKNKLTIVLDGLKKREYTFEKSKEREAFCQLMQYIRNKHSASNDPDCVSLFCGSWNMGDAMPPIDISSWFLCNGLGRSLDPSIHNIPHDIYVIGTQETGMPEKDWHAKVLETLQDITGANFHVVASDALWHIKILVIVKEEHKNRISHVQTSSVKTGIANALGNKGAVAVSFQFGGTSFCFINAHLTSGWEKCVRRNQNYHDIIRSLSLGENSLKMFGLTNRFDHLYFFGDLNYRLEKETGDIQEVLNLIKKKDLAPLLNSDQLKREKASSKAFSDFMEEEISFPPTYRYERGTRESYSFLKVKKTGVKTNIPSWCDRVLWRSYPETHNICLAYGCSEDIMTSDHSPLFSNFQVGVRGQYISKDEINPTSDSLIPSFINFIDVEVNLPNTTKQNFYLQFHSSCLTKSIKSGRGLRSDGGQSSGIWVRWSHDHLPSLKPIISDREYLVDQHLLLCICSEEDSEAQGECVIALKSKIANNQQHFKEDLTKKGEKVGLIRGQLQVQVRDLSSAPKEKTYDFICRDDDDVGGKREKIEEAPEYSGLSNFNSARSSKLPVPPADHQRNKFNRLHSLTVDVKKPAEAEYANTRVAAKNDSNFPSTNSRHTSPKKAPSVPSNFTNNYEGAFQNQDGRRITGPTNSPLMDRHVASNRLLHGARSTQPNTPSPGGSPGCQPTSPEFPTPPVFTDSPNKSVIEDLDLANAFAEFSNVDRMFDSMSRNDQLRSTPSPSPDSVYQSPTSFPVQPLSFPIVDPPRSNNSASSSPVSQRHNNTLTSSSAFTRRPTQGRGIPASVDEFLFAINLPQYSNLLQDTGWDSIEFLGEMTEDDLNEIGVTDPKHCRTILEHIKLLPS